MSDQQPLPSARTWRSIIEVSLQRLDGFLKTSAWVGRENEVVNLFAHRFLPMELAPGSPLAALDQIGIEVAVPQVTASVKKYVRKDLVLWNDGLHNPWHSDGPSPAAIIEWKVVDRTRCDPDIEWLRLFARRFPGTLGYSVCALMDGERGLHWTRVEAGGDS
jgi:hypothetical protein